MLFPGDFLTRLEYLSLISKRVFRGSLLAQRRTLQLGSGIEFSDHREYAPGDDFRYLDWNVYARHGDLLLKRFQEEQDLHVYLLLDCSRSMGFGNPVKFDLARQMVAALAYIALDALDRVAVIAFADELLEEFPLARGKARILPLMSFLERLKLAGRDTNLARSVQAMLQRHRRRGMIIVISDLFDPGGFKSGLDQIRFRRFDGRVIQIYDRTEAEPALLGDVELLDVETDSARKVTVTEKNMRTYKRLFADHQTAVRDYCRAYSMGCTQSNTNARFDELVMRMMRA
jgi:uncharacterized protein (DUF58 family)